MDNQIEEVVPVEEVIPFSDDRPEEAMEITPEEQERNEKFMRSLVINRFKTTLKEVHYYMEKNNVTLEGILEEINNKTCSLSRFQRDFVKNFKLEFIQQLLNDMYNG